MKGPLPSDDRMIQRNTGLAFSGLGILLKLKNVCSE